MRFALIGKNISHSLSPDLYRKIIGPEVVYDLIDLSDESLLPSLAELSKKYQGLNITSPFKKFYLKDVIIHDDSIAKLKAINTIALTNNGHFATNTDLLAVREILQNYQKRIPGLHLILLGSGVMARITLLVASELHLSVEQFSRSNQSDLEHLDLSKLSNSDQATLVINACSRDFHFMGNISRNFYFWDFNYRFYPHQNTLPLKVKEYQDGQEMLTLQAKAAWAFWQRNIH